MIVGEAEIVVTPVTAGFQKAAESELQGTYGQMAKDSETAGEDIGAAMSGGVRKETGKLADDVEKDGEKAGKGLSKGAGSGLKDLANVLSATGVPLGGFSSKLDETGGRMETLEKHSSGFASAIEDMPTPMLAAGAAVGVAAIASVKLAEGMEHAEASIKGVTGQATSEVHKIGDAFLGTAFKSTFSGKEMAQAFAQVAGQLEQTVGHALDAREAMQVMSAASDLAEAKGIGLSEATSTLGQVMQGFGMHTNEAAHAADVLFQASGQTGVSVESLAQALARMHGKLGETAGSVGDLSSLIVDMAHQGITGRAAVGALSTAMNTLDKNATGVTKAAGEQKAAFDALPPQVQELAKQYESGAVSSKEFKKETEGLAPQQLDLIKAYEKATTAVQTAQQKFKEMGVTVFNSQGNFVGMKSVIEQLHPEFAKMSKEQQLAAATTLFGAGAARQMLSVINAGPAAYDKASEAVNKHGAAEKAAEEQAKTLHGEIQKLSKGFEDLGVRLGELLIPIVTKFGQALLTLINVTSEVVSFIKQHWELLLPILEAPLIPLVLAFTKFKGSIEGIIKGLVSGIAGAWHSVESATSSLVGALTSAWQAIEHGVSTAIHAVIHFFEALPGQILGTLESLPGKMLHLGEAVIEGFINGVKHAAGGLLGAVKSAVLGPIEGIAEELGIKSPSRVTEKHGEAIAMGYAAGMRKAMPAVSSVAEQIVAFFVNKGLSPAQAAGIAGNAALESSYDPNAPGGGLFQTINGRGVPQGSSVNAQLESAWREMLSRGEVSGIKRTRSPQEAARFFETNFERPEGYNLPGEGGTAHSLQRQSAAGQAFSEYGGGGYSGVGAAASVAASAESSKARLAAEKAKLDKEVAQKKQALNIWAQETINAAKGSGKAGEAAAREQVAIRKAQFAEEVAEKKSALQAQTTAEKAALAKRTSDAKSADSLLTKGIEAIHKGGVKNLENAIFSAHLHGLESIERTLKATHDSNLKALGKQLTAVWQKVGAELVKAQVKAAEEAQVKAEEERAKQVENEQDAQAKAITDQTTIIKDTADIQAKAITDQSKIEVDRKAEAGLSGTELVAAQAQTALDEIIARNDAAVGAAELQADQAAGTGKVAEAQAQQTLEEARATQKVQEAEAQAKLEKSRAEAKTGTTATGTPTSTTAGGINIENLNINAAGMSAPELMAELGWSLKTGQLPVAT